ncbi:hypothetical protein [Methanoregula sp.]|uniref:hypothetical protein n=1 Tax=Methanoregula sp. TaxID=2052170 RepID=UPI002C0C0D14|nr:hypothetical protein [Methanoregula sp.]HVP96664.1 hypothetical protein [Methanoregula sp.]
MKGMGLKRFILVFGLLVLLVPALSVAYTVNSMTINPSSGALTPGTSVSLSYTVQEPSGQSSMNDLIMNTALTAPQWSYIIYVNGNPTAPTQSSSATVDISSFLLEYKSSDDVSIGVTLTGNAPTVTQTSNQTLVSMWEEDSNGNQLATPYTQTALVVNTADVTTAIANANTQLSQLKADIDEKSALGIDTSAAQTQYNTAQSQITQAQSLPSSQYTDALNAISSATTAITNGETLLDKSWAESEIATAQSPVNNVDALIAYFQGNSSTANDARLSTIITEREIAVSYISAANDAVTAGNFAQARSKAEQAYTEGNQSYNDALAFQAAVEANPFANLLGGLGGVGSVFSSSILLIGVGVVAVVLIIVGLIIYRKRSRWDELG